MQWDRGDRNFKQPGRKKRSQDKTTVITTRAYWRPQI